MIQKLSKTQYYNRYVHSLDQSHDKNKDVRYFSTQSDSSIEPTLSSGFVPFTESEDIISGERLRRWKYGSGEEEGRIQTICIRVEREYRSLSSWMREGRGDEGGEK